VDCNDGDDSVYPGATDVYCDGIDQDCSGADNCPCSDTDGDGYGNPGDDTCTNGPETDCDDGNDSIYPGATEVPCDGIDQDCSGTDFVGTDVDGDTYKTEGGLCGAVDCNDGDDSTYPGATEVPCDGIDQDCSGADNCFCSDTDGDGYGTCPDCGIANGCTYDGNDCDDGDDSVYPGATDEDCDGTDQDCSGADACIHHVEDCTVCHYYGQSGSGEDCMASSNLKGIKDTTTTPNSGDKVVVFTATTGVNSYADGDGTYDGVCEVCHTQTLIHTNAGDGVNHFDGENCIACHPHDAQPGKMFSPPASYGPQSHGTHIRVDKGPGINDCTDCHYDHTDYTKFIGNVSFAETTACDNCHSPGGAYNGVNDSVIGAKANWENGIYKADGATLEVGKEQWCATCHDDEPANSEKDGTGISAPSVAGDNSAYGFYASGHGRSATVECLSCHDASATHMDGEARTYAFSDEDLNPADGKSDMYTPDNSGVEYAAGYRLKYVDGEVPLMIPANYRDTFSYDAQTMRDTAFRLCFDCHDSSKILDDTPGDGITSNFKCSLPNPPKNYSYACGSGADVNEHVAHVMNYIGPFSDSDWDTNTTGTGGSNGRDSMTGCSGCHNVHGAVGAEGSSNEAMIRDGGLAGRTGYGFSYVIEDVGAGGYPLVTSTGATQANSVGSIFRNDMANMCGGSMCHGDPDPPSGSSYDASGSSWGTYLEYYRPWESFGTP